MKKFIRKSSVWYYGLIILILAITSMIAASSFSLDLVYLFDTSIEQIIEKIYISQLVVFMMNTFAFVYLLGSVYEFTFTTTNLSFLLSREATKEDIKEFLFIRALIPYLAVTVINYMIFYSKFEALMQYDSRIVIDPLQNIILLCIVAITIISMVMYYKTESVFKPTLEKKVIMYVVFIFAFAYLPTLINDADFSGRGILSLVFIVAMLGMDAYFLYQIKSSKKVDLC